MSGHANERVAVLAKAAYAAALDDSLWPGWVEALADAIDAKAATFVVMNAATGELRHQVPFRWGADRLVDEYFGHYQAFDPQLPMVTQAAGPTIYASESHLDERNPKTAEYMAWSRGAGGLDHHLSAVAPVGTAGWRVGLSAHTGVGAGPVPEGSRETLRRLSPDLVRAWSLGFAHNEMLEASYWDGLTARDDTAAVLLDECGRVVQTTARATEIVATQDGLSLGRSLLRCATASNDANLAALVRRAVDPTAPEGGAVEVTRPSGRRAYIVIAYPLVRPRRFLAPFEAAALLRIVERSGVRPGPGAALTQAFALTIREHDLALLLHKEHSVESAANTLGVALPTARLHLHRIFAKTGTTRQSELVRLMDTLG